MALFDLVVFDMAGTTIADKNEVEDCFRKAADQTGLQATNEKIVGMMGWSKKLVFETLWKEQLKGSGLPVVQERIEYSYTVFKKILENHYSTSPVFPVEGCLEIFAKLRENHIKIALTTGFYREVTDIILRRLNWDKGLDNHYVQKSDGIIDCSVTSDQVAAGRPAPFMIFRSMELLGITNIKKVVKIGDTPSDLLAGKNAGAGLNLGVTYGTHNREQLSVYDNDGLLDSLYELAEKLDIN